MAMELLLLQHPMFLVHMVTDMVGNWTVTSWSRNSTGTRILSSVCCVRRRFWEEHAVSIYCGILTMISISLDIIVDCVISSTTDRSRLTTMESASMATRIAVLIRLGWVWFQRVEMGTHSPYQCIRMLIICLLLGLWRGDPFHVKGLLRSRTALY